MLSWTHHWSYSNSGVVSSIIISLVILADHLLFWKQLLFSRWVTLAVNVPLDCVSVFLKMCIVVSCRTSILSEVSTRSSSKLPSGKNILVFGKCVKVSLLQCLQFICDGQP